MSEIIKSVEQIERERLTRRQALRKLGFGAGLSAFMLLGVDDLARMVGAKMQQMAGDNQVAEQIAHEFQNAGIAFASPSQGGLPGGCSANASAVQKANTCCTVTSVYNWCLGYNTFEECQQCCRGVFGTDGFCKDYNHGNDQNCVDRCLGSTKYNP